MLSAAQTVQRARYKGKRLDHTHAPVCLIQMRGSKRCLPLSLLFYLAKAATEDEIKPGQRHAARQRSNVCVHDPRMILVLSRARRAEFIVLPDTRVSSFVHLSKSGVSLDARVYVCVCFCHSICFNALPSPDKAFVFRIVFLFLIFTLCLFNPLVWIICIMSFTVKL